MSIAQITANPAVQNRYPVRHAGADAPASGAAPARDRCPSHEGGAPAADAASSDVSASGQSLLAGRMQLDLHFMLAQSFSATMSRQSADGYQEFRQSVERRFQADYSFDMSFLARMDGAAQKMGSLGGDVLNQFTDAAQKLASFSELDLKNFTQAADRLFNELGNAVGDSSAFDGARNLLKDSMSGFIHMVQGALEGQPPMPGPNGEMPPPPEGMQGMPPPDGAGAPPPALDFNRFYEETVKKFDEAFAAFLQNMMADAQKTMQDHQQTFLDMLKGTRDAAASADGAKKAKPLTALLTAPAGKKDDESAEPGADNEAAESSAA